jgi:hypothetical protein
VRKRGEPMKEILEKIGSADGNQIQALLMEVMIRYRELYPDWEINIVSLEKNKNQNEQIDGIIEMLKDMKK